MNVFIPIYNEIDSFEIIKNNIQEILDVFPSACVYFFDNASTDGTYEILLNLQQKYPDNVRIERNSENIGFQKNLSRVSELPDTSMIFLLGANDRVHPPGLHRLRSILLSDTFDLIVCGWMYIEENNKLTSPSKCDKKYHSFTATSLDEYFRKYGIIPNGIMQFVFHPRHRHLFGKYEPLMSPHVGAFFEFFPGKVYVMKDPPMTLVNKTEKTGWRSTAEGIIETHLTLAKDVNALSLTFYKKKQISLLTLLRLRFCYTHAVMFLLYKGVFVRNFWGEWQSSGKHLFIFIFGICKNVLFAKPLIWINPFILLSIFINFLICNLMRPFTRAT